MGDSEGGQKVSYASPAMILEQQTSGKEYPTGRVWKSQLVQKRLSDVGRGADMGGSQRVPSFWEVNVQNQGVPILEPRPRSQQITAGDQDHGDSCLNASGEGVGFGVGGQFWEEGLPGNSPGRGAGLVSSSLLSPAF